MIVLDEEMCVAALDAAVAEVLADGRELDEAALASAVYAAATAVGKDDARAVDGRAALRFCAELHPDILATGDEWISDYWPGNYLPVTLHAQMLARWCIENAAMGFLRRLAQRGSYAPVGREG